MTGKNDAFMKRLLAAFRVEADEHTKNITNGLIDLEKEPQPQLKAEIVEIVFREAHSLKGAARAVGRSDVEAVCQSLESVFSGLKRAEIDLSSPLFDSLHESVDRLNTMLQSSPEEAAGNQTATSEAMEKPSETASAQKDVPVRTRPVEEGRPQMPPIISDEGPHAAKSDGVVRSPKQTASGTLRISMEKMDSLLRQSEEMLSLKLISGKHVEDMVDLAAVFDSWQKEWAKIYPVICEFRRLQEKSDKLGRKRRRDDIRFARLLDFSESTHENMKIVENRLSEIRRRSDRDRYTTGLMVDSLLADVKKIMMLPFSSLFEAFPKLLRDLSHEQGKETELLIDGAEIEIDRRILEEMRTVFIHLLRNAIDHGIEKPDLRKLNGKKPRGVVRIGVSREEGNRVKVIFSDDGGGIDPDKLKEVSVKRGVVSLEDVKEMTDQQVLSLVFQSGVSTSPIITDISGRGLGLAIVREKIEKLGGQVSVETGRNRGISVKMVLPLTVATFRGVLVTAAERRFIIPTADVDSTIRIRREEIRTVENRDTFPMEGMTMPLVKLSDILELSGNGESPPMIVVLVVRSHEKRIGFCVDEILNEQEVLIKNLNQPLSRVRNIAAATILGSGKVVPVLNVSDMIKSAMAVWGGLVKAKKPVAEAETVKRSVLVVEDSITSRMLLKNILETSGYAVKTAVDGVDAVSQLKTEQFDAVVSDVDMPRMNGFNLTEKIRGDKKLASLPVILVTALGSREDRERGIDVGANAYIVKSSFDQSNLLETLRRLI